MKRFASHGPALAAALLIAACSASVDTSAPGASPSSDSDASTPSTDGSAPPLTAPKGSIALRVEQARLASAGGLQLSVTVSLDADAPPMPFLLDLFELKTKDGVVHRKPSSQASGARWWIDGSAPASTSTLTPGQSFKRWRFTFEDVRLGDSAPQELTLTLPSLSLRTPAVSASAPVNVEACARCSGTECTYFDRDLDNCGKCGAVTTGAMKCTNGQRTCVDAARQVCGDSCVDLQSDPEHCGACEQAIPSALRSTLICRQGQAACRFVGETKCTSGSSVSCVDLRTNAQNCGACGAEVPRNGACRNGVPQCANTNNTVCSDACVDVKTDLNHCGSCGNACTSGQLCADGTCAKKVNFTNSQYPDEYRDSRTCTQVCQRAGARCLDSNSTTIAPEYQCQSTAYISGRYKPTCTTDFESACRQRTDGMTRAVGICVCASL